MSEGKIPYITVKIPKEFKDLLFLTKPTWYESDGQRCFEVLKNGQETGEYVAYLLLFDGEGKQ